MKGLELMSYEESLRELRLFSFQQWRLKGGLIALCNSLKGGWVKVSLFSHATGDRTRGSRLNLCLGGSGWVLGKSPFTEGIIRHWNGLPGEVVESPLLAVIKRDVVQVVVAL